MKRHISFYFLVFLLVGSSCYAQESDRIDELERRITSLEESVSRIETMIAVLLIGVAGNADQAGNDDQEDVELKAKWRVLAVGMTPKQVRAILGEPERLDGGKVATWRYPRGGHITFMDGEVRSWVEPRF